ncbi:MAG TPA: phage tail tape measure protein, partial [Coriobacteriia bacterium]|nr:phage tail tape measure protein [Coriobacteriia bacterium]
MADRVTTIRLRAEIADLKRQMAEAGVAVKGVGDEAEKASERSNAALSKLSNTAGMLGLAMVAAAAVAVKAFADFDQSMSYVQAATHESAANMDLLREASIEAGKRTVFSATEAAGAVEELAKAGIATADILAGGLNGALDLAAAGGLDVAEAAGIAAIALKQFNLAGDQMPHVADLMAAGAGKAMGSVSDLGMALRQAGQVANMTGLTIEETTAGLSAFASAGLLGSDAGTSFKAMLQRLTPQSAEAQAKMDELGISAYDAGGNFIGLADFAGNLQGALKDLSPEQRNAALAVIFGSDAVRAANVLYDEGAAGIEEWTEKVDDSGYAAITAAIRLDNLKGDWEQLTGSIETALIGLGEGANGPLRDLVQQATQMVNAFAEAPPIVHGLLLALVGGGGLVMLGVAGMGKIAVALSETTAALTTMGVVSEATAAKMTRTGVALGKIASVAAGVAATAVATGMLVDELTGHDAELGANEIAAAIDAVVASGGDLSKIDAAFQNTGMVMGMSKVEADSLTEAFDQMLNPDVTDHIAGFFDAIPGVTGYMETLEERVSGVDTALSAMVAAGDTDSVNAFTESLRDAGYTTDEINKLLPLTKDALIGAAGAGDEMTVATEETTEAVAAQIPTLEDLVSRQAEAAGVVLSEREAQRAFQAAIDDATAALEKNGQTLDITTEAGRANQAALDDIAKSGWDVIASMQANGATQAELQAAMQVSRDAFVAMAIAEGMGADEANRLADKMGLIPAKVGVTVSVETSAAEARLAAFKRLLAIPDIVVTATMRTSNPYYASGLHGATGGLLSGPGTSTSDSIPAMLSNREY